jgi:hypothetical protein
MKSLCIVILHKFLIWLRFFIRTKIDWFTSGIRRIITICSASYRFSTFAGQYFPWATGNCRMEKYVMCFLIIAPRYGASWETLAGWFFVQPRRCLSVCIVAYCGKSKWRDTILALWEKPASETTWRPIFLCIDSFSKKTERLYSLRYSSWSSWNS